MTSLAVGDTTLWVSESQQELTVCITNQLKKLQHVRLCRESAVFWINGDTILLDIVRSYVTSCPDVRVKVLVHPDTSKQREEITKSLPGVNISLGSYAENTKIDIFLLSLDILTCEPPVDPGLLSSYLETLRTAPERILTVFSGERHEKPCYQAVLARQEDQFKMEKYPKVLYCDIHACGALKYLISQHTLTHQTMDQDPLRGYTSNQNSYHYRTILTDPRAMHCKLEVPDAIRKEIFAQIASQVYSVTEPSFFTGSRVLLFSPHPDDDVIAAGLGLQHLNTPEIILHIAYCVAGYNSVGDMYLEHVPEDPLDLCIKKTRVREAEARSALELLGVPTNHIHFLRLPFYNKNYRSKRTYDQSDIRIVMDIIAEVKPNHIFMAGDLADPHQTHEVCYNIIKEAIEALNPGLYRQLHSNSIAPLLVERIQNEEVHSNLSVEDIQSAIHGPVNFLRCRAIQPYSVVKTVRDAISAITQTDIPIIWLYRGSWNRFTLGEASLVICGTYDEVYKKGCAIRAHVSQMGEAMFMGGDTRSFDVRAHELCTEAAAQLSKFIPITAHGAEYYACSLVLL